MFTWTDLGIALSESHTSESIKAEYILGSLCLWQSPTVVRIIAVSLDPNDRIQMRHHTTATHLSSCVTEARAPIQLILNEQKFLQKVPQNIGCSTNVQDTENKPATEGIAVL